MVPGPDGLPHQKSCAKNHGASGSELSQGAFTQEALAALQRTSSFRLRGVLSAELSANVGACVHPSGQTLATAYYGTESRLDLWDLVSHKHIQSLLMPGRGNAGEMTGIMIIGPSGPVIGTPLPIRDLAMAPSGSMLAVACGSTVRLISMGQDGRSLSQIVELDGDQYAVHGVAFSHNGELLTSVSNDGKIALWSATSFQLKRQLSLNKAQLRSVAFSQDDLLLATGDTDGHVSVWDVATGQRLAFFKAHEGELSTVRFSPHGHLLATGGFDGQLRLWDMATAQPVGRPMSHGDSVYDLCFNKDGSTLYSCSFDHKVGVWRLDTQQLIDAYGAKDAVLSLGLSQDNAQLALVTSSSLALLSYGVTADTAAASSLPDSTLARARVTQEHHAPPPLPTINQPGFSPRPPPNKHVSVEGDVIIGEIDEAYVRARQASASNMRARRNPDDAPVAPPAPPGTIRSSLADLPGVPGQPPLKASGQETSTTTTQPASDSQPQPKASPATQRVKALRAAKRTRHTRVALFVATLSATLAAVIAFMTTPPVEESETYKSAAAAITTQHQQKLKTENERHQGIADQLSRREERVRRVADNQERRALLKQLRSAREESKAKHQKALDALSAEQDQALREIDVEVTPGPGLRALIAAALLFAGTMLLFQVLPTVASSRRPSR